MRVAITVEDGDSGLLHDLRRWLRDEPELRGRIGNHTTRPLPSDAMGLGTEALLAVLAPGGVAVVFAGALVAWVQSRRGDQTITVTRPDGTSVTVSATRVRGLEAEQTARLARELAAFLDTGDVTQAGPAPAGTGGADPVSNEPVDADPPSAPRNR